MLMAGTVEEAMIDVLAEERRKAAAKREEEAALVVEEEPNGRGGGGSSASNKRPRTAQTEGADEAEGRQAALLNGLKLLRHEQADE